MADEPSIQTPANCPQCGQPLARAVAGLCASCLAETAFLLGDMDDESAALSWDAPDRCLGDYDLIEEIGRGGMGTVWRARQRSLGREVALKVLPSGPMGDAEFLARFREEARLAARLHHPHIVAVHEVGEAGGHAFFSMDLVSGPTLAQRVRTHGPMGPRTAAACLEKIALAMQHAHESGVLHRDLKPSNILLESDEAPRVADFGLAKAMAGGKAEAALASELTLTRAVLGTPNFIAPEQARGAGDEISPRTDIHGLGAVLYFALTGRAPFSGNSVSAVLHEAQHREPPSPRLLISTTPQDLETICLKCLEKSPARRYQTAGELAADLRRYLNSEPVQARPPGTLYLAGKFLRRHHILVLAVAAVVLSLLAGLIGTATMAHRAREHARDAEYNAVLARSNEQRALSGEAESRRAQGMGDLRTASGLFETGRGVDALMHLARAVRTDPDNVAAATRLLAELAGTGFARPVRPLIELPEFIRDIRFSPDSQRLVAACHDVTFGLGPMVLFDAATGEDVTPEPMRDVRSTCADFSPSGRWLALGLPGRIVLFDPLTGVSGREFPFEGIPHSCSWSPDGTLLAATGNGRNGGVTLIWRSETGAPFLFVQNTEPVLPVCWSADGRRLAVNGPGAGVSVYDVATAGIVCALAARDDRHRLYAQGFSRDTDALAALEVDGPLRLFDASTGQALGDPFFPDPSMLPMGKISQDDAALVLVGAENRAARIWDRDLRLPVPLPSFADQFNTPAAFSPDGGMVALPGFSSDAALVFVDLDSGAFARATLRLPGGAEVVSISPDGTRVACGGRSHKLGLFDLRPRTALPLVIPQQEELWQVAFSEDDKSVVALGGQGRITSWNASTGAKEIAGNGDADAARLDLREGLRGHVALSWTANDFPADGTAPMHRWLPEAMVHGTVLAAAQSPDGKLVATGGRDHTLRLWHRGAGTPAQAGIQVPRSVMALAFDATGAHLAAGLSDGRVLTFDLPETDIRAASAVLVGPMRAIAWKPAGNASESGPVCIACAGSSGVSLFFPGQGRTLRLDGPTDEVRQVAWNSDGTRLAAGTASGAAWLWNGDGETVAGPLRHLSLPYFSGLILRFSPDGLWLATGGAHDGAVRLWSAGNGLAHAVLPTSRLATDLAFDRTGRRLAVLADGIVVWDPRTSQPLTGRRLLPDGEISVAMAWNRDGTRVAAVSQDTALCVFDLPPQLSRAPEWLAGFAEAFAGWRLDAQGLPQSVPDDEREAALAASAGAADTTDPVADWCAWVQRDPAGRGAAPYSARPLADYLVDLEHLNTVESLFNLNRAAPSRARHLAAKAWLHSSANSRRRSAPLPELAARLAIEAIAANPADHVAEATAALVLAMDGDPGATWPVLLRRAERAANAPDPWDNLASFLERRRHWPGVSATAGEAARLSKVAGNDRTAAWYLRLADDARTRATANIPQSFSCVPPLDPAGLVRFWQHTQNDPAAAFNEAMQLVAAGPTNMFPWHLLADALEACSAADTSEKARNAAHRISKACGRPAPPMPEADAKVAIESLSLTAPAREALTKLLDRVPGV